MAGQETEASYKHLSQPLAKALENSLELLDLKARTMAFSLQTSLLICLTLCVLVEEGFGLPISQSSENLRPASVAKRVRTKRCSCSNWMDKECIYFCHLDIIWVNTPSKITPYGLGSPLSRRRRSTNRCECANPNDATCSSFCHTSSMDSGLVVVSPLDHDVEKTGKDLLSYFRQVAKSNLIAAEHSSSPKKKPFKTNKSWIS